MWEKSIEKNHTQICGFFFVFLSSSGYFKLGHITDNSLLLPKAVDRLERLCVSSRGTIFLKQSWDLTSLANQPVLLPGLLSIEESKFADYQLVR